MPNKNSLAHPPKKIGRRVAGDWVGFPWAIVHAGTVIHRFHVAKGKDGKTAHESIKGRKSKREMLEFGESAIFIPVNDNTAIPTAEIRSTIGIWIGVDEGTGEHIVGTTEGIFATRTVRRRPPNVRWDAEAVNAMRGLAWMPYAYTTDQTLVSERRA